MRDIGNLDFFVKRFTFYSFRPTLFAMEPAPATASRKLSARALQTRDD